MIIPDHRYLTGLEADEAMYFIREAAEVAQDSLCLRSKCGSGVVQSGETIGRGFNMPPLGNPSYCTCLQEYDTPAGFRYDRTCCIHAEQEAIEAAKRDYPDRVVGARLYYAGLDKAGNLKFSRKPKCTVCSRWALHYGIAEVVLYHEAGVCVYSAPYYDRLSWQSLASKQNRTINQ